MLRFQNLSVIGRNCSLNYFLVHWKRTLWLKMYIGSRHTKIWPDIVNNFNESTTSFEYWFPLLNNCPQFARNGLWFSRCILNTFHIVVIWLWSANAREVLVRSIDGQLGYRQGNTKMAWSLLYFFLRERGEGFLMTLQQYSTDVYKVPYRMIH